MRIHTAAMILVVLAGNGAWGCRPSEWCICLILFGLVMALELVNTAVEAVVDLVTEERKAAGKGGKGHGGRRGSDCGDHGGGDRVHHLSAEACWRLSAGINR